MSQNIETKKLTDEQILGRLSEAWEDVKNPIHWAYETSKVFRVLGQLNKIAAAGSAGYIGRKLVVNRRGNLAASGIAFGTAAALGRHSWDVIQDTFKYTLGTVPDFIKQSAIHDLGSGVGYTFGKNAPTSGSNKNFDNLRNTYNNLKAEADARGILPTDHKYPLENTFQEHSYTQQTLAGTTTLAAIAIMQAGRGGDNHRGWHGKNVIAKAFAVTLQQVEDFYKDWSDDGGGYHGPHHRNEEFAQAPNAYDAPVRFQGQSEVDYAIQMAEHYANQMANGVAPGDVVDT